MLLPAEEICSLVRWALWLRSQGACPHVLELGTFVGLTTASWLSFGLEVTTIEKEPKYLQVLHDEVRARPQLDSKLNSVIHTIDDYFSQTPEPWKKFGLVFIDADKGAYYRYWQSFRQWQEKHPEWKGWLVFDNMFLGGEMLSLWEEAGVAWRELSVFNQGYPLDKELETQLDFFLSTLAQDTGEKALRLPSRPRLGYKDTATEEHSTSLTSAHIGKTSKRWSQRIKHDFLRIYQEARTTPAQVDLLDTSDGMLVVRYL